MPALHREQGYRLGRWVSTQRENKDTTSPERRQRLDALGFVWDLLTMQWEEGFCALQSFHQREGHCRVSQDHREQDYPLGTWVSDQRYRKDTTSPERRQRLDALGFMWNAVTTKWDEGFRYLTVYCQREGVTLPRFYRHLSKEENDEIGGDHASTSATSVYGGI